MSKKRKIVEVTWEDSAYGEAGWADVRAEKPSTVTCYSVGYIFKSGKGQLHLVPHTSDRAKISRGLGRLTIPTSAIRKLRRLK